MIEQINELIFAFAKAHEEQETLFKLSSLSGLDIITLIRIRDKTQPLTLYQLLIIAKALKLEISIRGSEVCFINIKGERKCVLLKY